MIRPELHPRITGVLPKPDLTRVPAIQSVSRLLRRKLPTLTSDTPVLIQTGTGTGKTTAILESAVPFVIENGLNLWFVSSRAAINTQFKQRLARQLALNEILTDYTPEGLRRLEDIGPVKILTYHHLWDILKSKPNEVKRVGILVFDEIHALALDATFVGFTGQLLQRIPVVFGSSLRLYLSATPEPILPDLIRAEGNQRITIYRWPAHYQQFRLHFYSSHDELINHLNSLPDNERVLVFVPSIAEGKLMQNRLRPTNKLISTQTKEAEPDLWSNLLENGHLNCQILLATSTLDAGVSLHEPTLKHIVCYGLNPAEVLQQAGRKRVKSGERLNLYLFNPSRRQLGNEHHKAMKALSSLNANRDNPPLFLQKYILEDGFPSARLMSNLEGNLTITVNPLSLTYYQQRIELLEKLLRSQSSRPAEALWRKTFKQPKVKIKQLGHQDEQEAASKLQAFLQQHIGQPISTPETQAQFAQEFQHLYADAYGPRKNDRADRNWKLTTCRKVLVSLNWGFTISSTDGSWILQQQGGDLHE